MLEMKYHTGEPMRIGDYVTLCPPLVETPITALVKLFTFPWEEKWAYLRYKNPGILFAEENERPLFTLELKPKPEYDGDWFTSEELNEDFRKKWACVNFLRRGAPRYYTGEIVRERDWVVCECGHSPELDIDTKLLGVVGKIIDPVLTPHLMRIPLDPLGWDMTDLGITILNPKDLKSVIRAEQIVDEASGFYTDMWQDVHFVCRGYRVDARDLQ